MLQFYDKFITYLFSRRKDTWLFIFLVFTALAFERFNFPRDAESRALIDSFPYYASITIWVAIYSLLSIVITPIPSFLILSGSIYAIYKTSKLKLIATGEPLILGDISHINHISIAAKYAPKFFIILILISLISLFFYMIFRMLKMSNLKRLLAVVCVSSLILSYQVISQLVSYYQQNGSLKYYAAVWQHNANANGLLLHLIQTGQRPIPDKPTKAQAELFNQLAEKPSINAATNTFIAILCESCWHDDQLFSDEFDPLTKEGMIGMRGISPIFGGGTVNSSFEILTGLPTLNGSVGGIIYQEYRDLLRKNTVTLPSILAENDIHTESLHNHDGSFWFRNRVEPRLGFNQFFGLEDMPPPMNYPNGFPRDKVLFDFALDRIVASNNKNIFLHLATVHGHGPYDEVNGDNGHGSYISKMKATVEDLVEFIQKIKRIKPDTVILVYGDHKPALPSLSPFLNESSHIRGDVPIWVLDSNQNRVSALKHSIDGKPFYCFPSAISKIYYNFDYAVSNFTSDACTQYEPEQYLDLSASIPGWVYTAALLKL
ncbi:LTA synthase family protein [Pseudochrobactrum sp. sp1633]|uniref:LTA synthase family protein n=1 Tax=Pseudochrobactrum sp. sp1633 TaxID=3036706 RepID=UPI0025A58028|nr:LTA synthase family protein [Pseudochrobactrum sp. sp1633]MDM8344524.1 LTA synthase family protein [Pseudochrobactrum sp. sp1633]